MKECYNAETQILTIQYEDFMNTVARIPMSLKTYKRLEGIKANVDMRLAEMDLTPYKIN